MTGLEGNLDMIEIKSAAEIEAMKRPNRIVAEVLAQRDRKSVV